MKEKKYIIPKSSQDTLPIEEIYQNGLIKNKKGSYSKIILLSDLNYVFARDEIRENIFNQYCNILNSLNCNVNIQLFITNNSINQNELLDKVKINRNDDYYPDLLDEYNSIIESKVRECGNRTSNKKIYLVLTVEANSVKSATEQMEIYTSNLDRMFKRIECKVEELNVESIIELLYYFYNPIGQNKKEFYLHHNSFAKSISLKDILSPPSFKFKRDFIEIGPLYSKIMFLRDLPTSLTDSLIAELLDCNLKINISIHIEPTEPGNAIQFIRRRITSMESNKMQYTKKAGLNLNPYIPYDLKTSLEEANDLIDSLTKKNKKLFYVSFYFNIIASTEEELIERTGTLESICRRHLVLLSTLSYQQEDGLTSVLPIGWDKVGINRSLLTDSTAIFIPFTAQNLLQENGFYYGINQMSKSLTVLSRKLLENPAGFVLGRPRSGKSFSSKREIVSVLLSTNDDVIVIDPEAEYCNLCENFNGEVVKISANSNNYINPLDMEDDYGAGENPVLLKSEFILSIFECLIGTLKPVEKGIIDRVLNKIYLNKTLNSSKLKDVPTLVDLYYVLKQEPEDEAKNLALSIELYVNGSLNMFSKNTNINMNNRFMVFNTRDLGKQLKTLGMLIVLDFVWNRVCYNWKRQRRTWVYVDEFYMLFSNPYIGGFFNEFYKRAQKRGGIPTGITQNVQEILSSEMARYMLSNSEFMMLFNQSPSDREELQKLLKISSTQMAHVSDSSEGSGLMIVKNIVIPFVDKFPTDTNLYKMMTTKVSDLF